MPNRKQQLAKSLTTLKGINILKFKKWRYSPTCFFSGLGIALTLNIASVFADDLHLAVAANFTKPIKQLKRHFENHSSHRVIISFGATGQLYTQIQHGATFDILLAADMKRPKMLISEGLAVKQSLLTYAIGKLVLWSLQPGLVDKEGKVLSSGQFRHLAIAHPKLAPYGTAAKQVLEKMGLWQTLQSKIVRGHNISHAYQFTATGAAELGFIALSQYRTIPKNSPGSHWPVPKDWYTPIKQGAVLLKKGENNQLAKAFLAFLQTPLAQKVIVEFGYQVPKKNPKLEVQVSENL